MFARMMVTVGSFGVAIALAAGAVEALLATDPIREAERAFAMGDHRYLVIPFCGRESGEVLPGWPLTYSPAHRDAIERGKRPVTCSDIGDDPERRTFVRVSKHAEKYNQQLLHLTAKDVK